MAGPNDGPLMPPPDDTVVVDRSPNQPTPGIALCLSGGGYRAMLFHAGALYRLNTAGYLGRLDLVSSVSGGSITAAQLGVAWAALTFGSDGVASNFVERVVSPLRALAAKTIDVWAVLLGIVGTPFGMRAANFVARAYRRHLFGTSTLQALPHAGAGPRFVINATSLQSGVLWRLSQPYAWDWRVGELPTPTLALSDAVAASSAFPPFLSPFVLRLKSSAIVPGTGSGEPDISTPPYTTRIRMTDGGVYDNLGVETAWKNWDTILVSDGGGQMQPAPRPWGDWILQTRRVLEVIDNQVRDLRKRQVVGSFGGSRKGTYWGIRSDIANYQIADALPCPDDRTMQLANIPTRLAAIDEIRQERLINWGFAICDAGMRRWVDTTIPRPSDFPYPAAGV